MHKIVLYFICAFSLSGTLQLNATSAEPLLSSPDHFTFNLSKFHITKDLAFFDFDNTLAKDEVSKDGFRQPRLKKLVQVYNIMKEAAPWRVFIYSMGNQFRDDFETIGLRKNLSSFWYSFFSPSSYSLFVRGFGKGVNYTFAKYEYEFIDKRTDGALFYFYPAFSSFHINAGRNGVWKSLTYVQRKNLKGDHLKAAFEFLGYNATNPIRDFYFVDDSDLVIEAVTKAAQELQMQHVIWGNLYIKHWPTTSY